MFAWILSSAAQNPAGEHALSVLEQQLTRGDFDRCPWEKVIAAARSNRSMIGHTAAARSFARALTARPFPAYYFNGPAGDSRADWATARGRSRSLFF